MGKVNRLITLPWAPQPSPVRDVPPTWSGFSPTTPTASRSSRGTRKSWSRGSPAWPSSAACLQAKGKGVRGGLVISLRPIEPEASCSSEAQEEPFGSKDRAKKGVELMRSPRFLVEPRLCGRKFQIWLLKSLWKVRECPKCQRTSGSGCSSSVPLLAEVDLPFHHTVTERNVPDTSTSVPCKMQPPAYSARRSIQPLSLLPSGGGGERKKGSAVTQPGPVRPHTLLK